MTAIGAWHALAVKGHVPNYSLSFNENDRVSIADGGKAILVWRPIQSDKGAYILMGWVDPTQRRKGLYTQLYNAVKRKAKQLGMVRTLGGIMLSNKPMVRAAINQGRKPMATWYEQEL